MLLNDGGDPVNPLLHVLYIVNPRLELRGLFFPGFSGHIQQPSRSPPEENFKEGEPSGCLWHLLDGKKHIGKKEVPVLAIIICHLVNHPLECLVKVLHQAISLGVVDRGLSPALSDTDHPLV